MSVQNARSQPMVKKWRCLMVARDRRSCTCRKRYRPREGICWWMNYYHVKLCIGHSFSSPAINPIVLYTCTLWNWIWSFIDRHTLMPDDHYILLYPQCFVETCKGSCRESAWIQCSSFGYWTLSWLVDPFLTPFHCFQMLS